MSGRCYEAVQKIMDLYESGQLERKRTGSVLLAIHATYFDFLCNFNVLEQEEEVYQLLNNICLKGCRPSRRQNNREKKV